MPQAPHISAVVPAYNEAESLPGLIDELARVLDGNSSTYEIVLVDDGSTDGTAAWIANAARTRPHVRAVLLERNSGQSAALGAGLRHARGEVLVTLDADGQNDPADIPKLIAALGDADVASGIRTKRADTWIRRISSKIANATRRLALGDTITDIGCSLKAYRRQAVEGIPIFVGAHRFLPALCQFRGARVVEIPVQHRPRTKGVSKYGVGNRLFRGIRDLFGVRWLKARMPRDKVREVIGD